MEVEGQEGVGEAFPPRPRGRRRSFQKFQKWLRGECTFCGEKDIELLDCHRVVFGSEGGKYTPKNTVVTCCSCHRKIHAGRIEVHGRYLSTRGRYATHYTENGVEKWHL